MNEVLLLKARNLIATREMITASANNDVAVGGSWSSNYALQSEEINVLIEDIFKQLETDGNNNENPRTTS